jgi:type I restriction enzyme S subunit
MTVLKKVALGDDRRISSALSDDPRASMTLPQKVRLGDVCGISSALVDPRQPQYLSMPHVGGANIESMTGKLVDVKSAEEEGLKSGKFLFDEQTVLYSKIRPYLMKVARPDFKGLCSADVYPLSPTANRIERDYLFHLLLTPTFTDYAISGSARAGMPKVNRDHLFEFRFDLPPLAEQRRIVGILDKAFEAIATAKANYQRNLAALDDLKQSLLHRAFNGNL